MKHIIGFLFVMITINFVRGEEDLSTKSESILIRLVRQANTCAQLGEYCQTHSDCCSKSCLSFSYKCTGIHKPVQSEFQRPATNQDITNRFTAVVSTVNNTCAANGEYCQDHYGCCSRNCNRFTYQCGQNHGLALQQQHFQSVLNPPAPQGPNTVDTLINRFATVDAGQIGNRVSGQDNANGNSICRALNQQCYNDNECCQGQCDYTTRTCLLTAVPAPTTAAPQQRPTLVQNSSPTTIQQNNQQINNQQQFPQQFFNQQQFPQFNQQFPQLFPNNFPNRMDADQTPNFYGGNSRGCSAIGSKCFSHNSCCTSRCHSFLHQCVT